jgi:hypothetical protein
VSYIIFAQCGTPFPSWSEVLVAVPLFFDFEIYGCVGF